MTIAQHGFGVTSLAKLWSCSLSMRHERNLFTSVVVIVVDSEGGVRANNE
jgi:hypothetical protein